MAMMSKVITDLVRYNFQETGSLLDTKTLVPLVVLLKLIILKFRIYPIEGWV